MSRVRMSWDWVGEYPIFVYTRWIAPSVFHVKLVKGTKGNQNAGDTGPSAPAWFEYESTQYLSKDETVQAALRIAKKLLAREVEA